MPPRLLILGAHPDDVEYHAGALVVRACRAGHDVKMVSVTCGDSGHHRLRGTELAAIRRGEAQRSAEVVGAVAEVWEYPDGRLEPTLAVRERIIREIRTYRPDLVLTHRTNDYHPDHRAVGHAVRDACYMVTVPVIVPDVPIVSTHPVVAFLGDHFTKPTPIQPDVILDATAELDTVVDMMCRHRSQFFEWLPFNRGESDKVPAGEDERRNWLREWYLRQRGWILDRYRREIDAAFGPDRAKSAGLVEVYEVSEYGAPLRTEDRERLFPGAGGTR